MLKIPGLRTHNLRGSSPWYASNLGGWNFTGTRL